MGETNRYMEKQLSQSTGVLNAEDNTHTHKLLLSGQFYWFIVLLIQIDASTSHSASGNTSRKEDHRYFYCSHGLKLNGDTRL